MSSLRIFITACETSGDAHGAHLVEEMKQMHPHVTFQGIGGPRMREAGVDLLEDMTRISALGFGDVVRQYFKFREIFYDTIAAIREFKPDAVVVLDSPAFNLRLAKKISADFPVIYYISPQLWAWGGRRISVVQKHIRKMLTILPFEVDLYKNAGVPVEFVGHPLLDQVQVSAERSTLRQRLGLEDKDYAVGLLAGSRKREVERILPVMLESAQLIQKKIPRCRFFVNLSPNVEPGLYEKHLIDFPELRVELSSGKNYNMIAAMDFALVTSGTATLETALIGTPYFLLYKTSWSTYLLGKQLIKVPYLGIVNLLAKRSVVPEFIQYDAVPERIALEAENLFRDKDRYQSMKSSFEEVRAMLGEPGAGKRAAKAVLDFTRQNLEAATETRDK